MYQIKEKLQTPIFISGISTVSALGTSTKEVWQSYLLGKPLFKKKKMGDQEIFVSIISSEMETELNLLRSEKSAYRNLDRTVLLALLAAKNSFQKARFPKENLGINIGSSRGATTLFEDYYRQFQQHQKVSPYASPTTTLGNISSWVGQELGVNGIQIGHSVTCSTALHAILNGIAWLNADMANGFLAGGSESALTQFTIAQMQALKLYSDTENAFACESMRFQKKKNTMVLGEGAAVALLEKTRSANTSAVISGFGFASEIIAHNSAISENAICFQESMSNALKMAKLNTVDAIVMHAPGTVKGDLAEKNAIDTVFKAKLPLLTSNKWLIGHTFGASGMMSVEMAALMLQNNQFIENPFFSNARHLPQELKTVLVNAVGFGGNAVSILLSK